MKAILIDDEYKASDILETLLGEYCPEVQVVARCLSTAEGLVAIARYKPDIVFLDIEMPEESGLDLLLRLQEYSFEPVFVTGHNEFARQAFGVSAVDYLLKPVQPMALQNAVLRAKVRRGEKSELERFRILFEAMQGKVQRIALPGRHGATEYIPVNNIVHCESDGSCTHFHLIDKRRIVTGKNIGEYVSVLHPYGIRQAHRQHLVALRHVLRYHHEDAQLEMVNGERLPLSRGYKDAFLKDMLDLL